MKLEDYAQAELKSRAANKELRKMQSDWFAKELCNLFQGLYKLKKQSLKEVNSEGG